MSNEVNWYLQLEDGTTYGPTSESKLHQWVAEGRVSPTCRLRREHEARWLSAADLFPILRGAAVAPPPQESAFPQFDTSGYSTRQANDDSQNPYASPHVQLRASPYPPYGASGAYRTPHRGGTVLTLGILSLLICGLLGPFAWSMGRDDLAKMSRGQMDYSGHGITQAGMICGMIATIFLIISVGFLFFVVLAGGMR